MADGDRKASLQSGPTPGDDAWLAALAGRAVDAPHDRADASAALEGKLLRTALRSWPPPVEAVAAIDPARLRTLIERARVAGLLDRRASSGSRVRDWWEAGKAMGARPVLAMTVLVVVTSGVVLVTRPGVSPPAAIDVERGAPAGVMLLRDADPEGLRRRIVDALSTAGLKVTTYSRFGRYGLDADIPQPIAPDVRAVLDRFRVPVPQDDVLRIEVEAAR